MVTKKSVELTKGDAYLLFTAIIGISARNKQETFLNYDLSVKLLYIKKALQITMDALEEAKVTLQVLFADKELTEYALPTFTEEELKIFIKGPDELEAFEKLAA